MPRKKGTLAAYKKARKGKKVSLSSMTKVVKAVVARGQETKYKVNNFVYPSGSLQRYKICDIDQATTDAATVNQREGKKITLRSVHFTHLIQNSDTSARLLRMALVKCDAGSAPLMDFERQLIGPGSEGLIRQIAFDRRYLFGGSAASGTAVLGAVPQGRIIKFTYNFKNEVQQYSDTDGEDTVKTEWQLLVISSSAMDDSDQFGSFITYFKDE